MTNNSWGRQRGLGDGEEEDKTEPGEEEVVEREIERERGGGGEEDKMGWLHIAV
jgi:hypothetical protein